MIESLSRQHPLFDPASLYNQMRSNAHFTGDKMRGYWGWLCVQQDRAQEPLPPPEPRPERELGELTSRLTELGPKGSVLHALRVCCWIVGEGEESQSLRAIHDTAEVLLVREEDGTRAIGLLLEGDVRRWFPMIASCRAFLLEPAMLQRLASALRTNSDTSPDQLLRQAFQREMVLNSYPVASLLCAFPELEGDAHPTRSTIHFVRLPIPGKADLFPPRAGLLQVAVFVDT
jgi:hypothetical protein